MINEAVLLESRTLRGGLAARTEALDKVKALMLLPDEVHVTTRMVAGYFEVREDAIRQLVARHRDELRSNGAVVLRGSDLDAFKRDVLSLFPSDYPQPRANLGLFPRRAVLNVAMLLRDSEVARDVRGQLLDLAEPALRPRAAWTEAMVAEIVERALAVVRDELDESRKAYAAVVRQLELERSLVGAMSTRLADTSCEVRTLGGRVDMLCELVSGPGRRRGPYGRGRP
jgi:hypothetical protein